MGPATKSRGAEEARHLHDQGRLSGQAAARLFGVVIRRDDLVGDVRRAAAADWASSSAAATARSTAASGSMTPQTNDAYNGSLRDIVFPAGILQAPIFDAAADPAINYGAIGGVIGHEMTHGFDDQGRTSTRRARFATGGRPPTPPPSRRGPTSSARNMRPTSRCRASTSTPELTMGENIADLGGLSIALDAYHRSLHGKPAPVIGGLTGDQRVFLGWAQAWAGKAQPDSIRAADGQRPAQLPQVPRQRRGPEHRRLVFGLRGEAGRQAAYFPVLLQGNQPPAHRARPRSANLADFWSRAGQFAYQLNVGKIG
jgi:putative endopeptidase